MSAPDCQIVQVSHNACDTCPLAEKQPEEPPSPFLQHLVWLARRQEVGAVFGFDELSGREWEGLHLLKRKQNERELKEFNDKNKKGRANANAPTPKM